MDPADDDLTYEEHIALAKTAELNDVRLGCTDDLCKLWQRYLSPLALEAYCEEQYGMLLSFCKAVIEGGDIFEPDYEQLTQRSYALFAKAFNAAATRLSTPLRDVLFKEFNDRVMIGLYRDEMKGEEYDFRILSFVLYLNPPKIKEQSYFKSFTDHRTLHEHKVNLIH